MEESWQRPLTWSHSSQLLGVNTFEASPDEGKIKAGKPYAYYWLVNKIEFRVTFSLSNSWNMGFFWYLPCHQSGFDAQKFLLVPSPVWCICIYILCSCWGAQTVPFWGPGRGRWQSSQAPRKSLQPVLSTSVHMSPTMCLGFFLLALVPSGKRLHNYGKIHHFQWENPLFLWSFSIATLNYQRVASVKIQGPRFSQKKRSWNLQRWVWKRILRLGMVINMASMLDFRGLVRHIGWVKCHLNLEMVVK